jgi:hypothetical protein
MGTLREFIDQNKRVSCKECKFLIRNSYDIMESNPWKRMPYFCKKFFKHLTSARANDKQSIIPGCCFYPSIQYIESESELF